MTQSGQTNHIKHLVDELSNIEFDTGSDIQAYTRKVRDLLKSVAVEVDYAAQELQARLAELPPPPGESARTARRRAKTVSRHLRRSAEAARSGAIESVRTWASLRKHYEHILRPTKAKKRSLNLGA